MRITAPYRQQGARRVPWWSLQLRRLHWETRKVLNKAIRTGMPPAWRSFKNAQRWYKSCVGNPEREFKDLLLGGQ
jgi:hypothetical protein